MKPWKLLLAGISFMFILAVPGLVSADVNDFTVTSFMADETLSRADPQGELHIIEHINVTFRDYNHGLLRAIPASYKHHSLQLKVHRITSSTQAPVDYTTYTSHGNTVLKIGSPTQTVTGPQAYTIDYSLRNVISFYPDHDELYWDVNGDQWQQPFLKVEATLHLPADLKQDRSPVCYAGDFGASVSKCTVVTSGSNIQISATGPLSAKQTLTFVTGFSKGYFRPSKWYESAGEYWKQIVGVLAPIIAIGGGSALYWWRKGRDAKGSGIIVPQYSAPDGLKPLAVGTLLDFKVDNRDITATIIDLAIRGYVKIVETKEDKLIGKDKLSYKLQLANADFSQLDEDEMLLLSAFFQKRQLGTEIDISSSKNKLYTTAAILKKNVKGRLKEAGYFRNDPLSSGTVMHALGRAFLIFVIGCVLFAIVKTAFIIGLVVGVLIALPFWRALDARTAKGVVAYEHVRGLKHYLEVAEKERLEKLQAPNAAYAADAGEPVKTVELYEKLLPYAMVLGVEKQWSKQFESLYTSPPDWYSGNWSTFNAYYLASSLNDGIGSAVNSAFSAPSSSGGSGFSGGSSGGGGGGGGGGGW